MNMKDIALLKYKHFQDGKLTFYRAKTINTAKADLSPVVIYANDFFLNQLLLNMVTQIIHRITIYFRFLMRLKQN